MKGAIVRGAPNRLVLLAVMALGVISVQGAGVGAFRPARTEGSVTQQTLRPTSNGIYTEWGELWGAGTTHWDRVEETTADDSGSYIMDNSWNGTERDTFQLSNTTFTTIGSVEVVARAVRITTNDNNNVRLFLRSGSTDAQSPVMTLSTAWNEVSYRWTTNPADGQPWTQSAVNSLQAGVRNAMSGSGGGGVGVTQVYVVVTQGLDQIIRPTGNGTYTEWGELWGSGTTHWDRVEEVTPDDNASYVMDNSWNGTERDTFQLSDTSYTTILSIEVVARAKRITTNDNNNVRLIIRSGSTDSQSPVKTLSTSWSTVSYEWTTNPATGQAWTQPEVNALQAGVRNAMSGGGGGGVGVTQVYVIVHDPLYPPPSMGVDNYGHYGASYTSWAAAGASGAFGFQAPGTNGQYEVDSQFADAASAYQAGKRVYVYFCLEPQTTEQDIWDFVDSLDAAGVFNYLNFYGGSLYVVYDIEDDEVCGPWVYVDLPTAETWISNWSVILYARAHQDGLQTNRAIVFSATPGLTAYIDSGTVELTNWIVNSGQLASAGTYFPQLFGYRVNGDNWGVYTDNRLDILHDAGLTYPQTSPNWEDYNPYYQGDPYCDTAREISDMRDWYMYLASNQVTRFAWYPYNEPFCVP